MATSSRKTVAMLFLGGATIDERHRLGDTVTKAAHVKPWLKAMSEMDIIADTQGVFIASGTDVVGLPEWSNVAETVRELYDDVDGFVVVHQVETMPVAATALSLMFSSIGKPVVLCGSNIGGSADTSGKRLVKKGTTDFGAKANFINAVQVAVSDIAGVVLVYGSHIYRGDSVIGPMSDIRGEVLGKIDFGIRFFGHHATRHQRSLGITTSFTKNVAVIEYLPGVDVRQVLHVSRDTAAVFLSTGEATTNLSSVVSTVRELVPSTIPIVIYPGALPAVTSGMYSVKALSRSAALLKTMWAFGQTTEPKKLRKILS